MKKLLTVGSALLLLSTSAFATESRLLALGMNETDNEGMFYIQDGRNIFLNSANVNLYPDQLVTEYGSTGLTVGAGQTVDQNHRPKAQGGVFKKYGGMTYGVYYGNESNTSSLLRIAGTRDAATPPPTADNQLDLFVGGDAGIKWGANVTYANNKNETSNTKDSALSTRFGLIGSGWDALLNLSLGSKSESAAVAGRQKFDGKIGFQVGGSYLLGDAGRVFGYVKHYGWDEELTGASTVKGDFTSYYLGYGRDMTVNTNGKIFASVGVKKTDINLKFTQKGEVRHLIVPLNIGYEAVATEWLTLRGSIVQNLYGKRDNKRITGTTDLLGQAPNLIAAIYGTTGKGTIANSTEVNAGATLTFGQLALDGMIGLTSNDRGTGSTGVAAPNKNQGLLALDNLGSRVALTYKF
ncbi:MAG: hypothetical protein H7336_15865 [Bacteriovorax sp.]|nr:hypothetical protein [Bacteriovorax sp.]